MADDKDSVSKLKDLTFLKNQLESLQRRVESEVNSGVSQFAHFAATSITLLGNGTMKDGVEEGPQPRDPLKHPECSTWQIIMVAFQTRCHIFTLQLPL
ncbi:uncharacterized protein [Oryctolagus cuniculus]|uniref:uncharacterized protein isoform X3 n=1 Tax=Oryctolagus cuniculus TaxID=9986 RepID=UPI0038799605